MSEKYGTWSAKELRVELKRRNARNTGKKEDLIQRLSAYDRNNDFNIMDDAEEAEVDAYQSKIVWPPEDLFRTVQDKSYAPPIDIGHLNQYFYNLSTGPEGITICAAVQRIGYSMMEDFFLLALVEVKIDSFFYRGQVNSEMTKNLTYFIRICINAAGCITESSCECVAGKGPAAVCKHIACVSFAILNFKEHGVWNIRNTCTDKKQSWRMPKKSRLDISPQKAENINFSIPIYNVKKKQYGNMCYDPRPVSFKSLPAFNDNAKNMIISYNNTKKRKLALTGTFDAPSMDAICSDHDYFKHSLQQQLVYNRIMVTQEEAEEIEKKTRNQTACPYWFEERSLRITASKVGNIMKMTKRRNKTIFAEHIVNPKSFRSISTDHGMNIEKKGIEAYQNFTTNTVAPAGLFISPEYPFIGGSPDGLISQETVLEVKCPHSIKDECITESNVPYIHYKNNVLCLKETSTYYYQVQTQMFVTNRNYCDFVIWTNRDYVCLSVEKDNELINNVMLPKVKEFYDSYVVPTIYKKFYS